MRCRDFFLIPANYADSRSDLVRRFGELMRKVWDARAFRGQVSPHEFLQAVIAASQRAFTTDAEADPVAFWTWLLNALHLGLTNGARKKRSVITQCFQVRPGAGRARPAAPTFPLPMPGVRGGLGR